MEFPFVYEVEVDGHCIAEIEGVAMIGIDDAGRDWRLAAIMFARREPGRGWITHVLMPKTHWLYARLASALLNQSRQAIDEAWAAYRADDCRELERHAEVA